MEGVESLITEKSTTQVFELSLRVWSTIFYLRKWKFYVCLGLVESVE